MRAVGAVVAFVADTDRHVQRAFDWCVHAIMRATGAEKVNVRFAVNFASFMSILMKVVAEARWYADNAVVAVLMFTWAACLFLLMGIEERHDLDAAARGMISRADSGSAFGDKAWGIVASISCVTGSPSASVVAACGLPAARFSQHLSLAFWLLLVAHGYLKRTPPKPPARRRRVPARIAPQGA